MADVFRRYGAAYRQEHGASLSMAQRRAMPRSRFAELPFSAVISSSVTTAAINATLTTPAAIDTVQNASPLLGLNGSKTVRPNS